MHIKQNKVKANIKQFIYFHVQVPKRADFPAN